MPDLAELRAAYELAKSQCGADWKSDAAANAIFAFATMSVRFLRTDCSPIDLVSRVPGKQYVSFTRKGVVARPANRALFVKDERRLAKMWSALRKGKIDRDSFAQVSYTIALAPCLVLELFDRGNKKAPATYFECFIGHLFASSFGVNPQKRAVLPVQGRSVQMTMDFLFDLGKGRYSLHLAVKMSTRERVVQAWAHQRLLDAAYGADRYKGIMVLFSETKLDSRSREVIEICVPDQWLAYQSLLAKMDRIYYFDTPYRYQQLTEQFPDVIRIKPFGEFFSEKETVALR